MAIQDCRSSGLPVRQWCRERGITPTTYYRWERELLSIAGSTATLHLDNVSIDIYPQCGAEQLTALVEILRTC